MINLHFQKLLQEVILGSGSMVSGQGVGVIVGLGFLMTV